MMDEEKTGIVPINQESKDIVEITPEDENHIKGQLSEVAQQIIYAPDQTETQDLINTFNLYLAKKNAIRTVKLDGLYDEIVAQILLRFKNRGGEFSNKDLLDYLTTVETAIEKSNNHLSQVENQPPVTLKQTNTQVNINLLDTFNHDQKTNIADAIKAILDSAKNTETFTEAEYEEKTNEDEKYTNENS